MGMAKDTDVRPRTIEKGLSFFDQLSALKDNMSDRDAETIQLDDGLSRKATLFVPIRIAGHGSHGSNHLKLIDNQSIADIAGMNNVIHATKVTHDRWIEQAMRIGNHTNTDPLYGTHRGVLLGAPCEARTLVQSNVKGSGFCFGISASWVLRRSALALLIGWVESHSTRPSSFSASR